MRNVRILDFTSRKFSNRARVDHIDPTDITNRLLTFYSSLQGEIVTKLSRVKANVNSKYSIKVFLEFMILNYFILTIVHENIFLVL